MKEKREFIQLIGTVQYTIDKCTCGGELRRPINGYFGSDRKLTIWTECKTCHKSCDLLETAVTIPNTHAIYRGGVYKELKGKIPKKYIYVDVKEDE